MSKIELRLDGTPFGNTPDSEEADGNGATEANTPDTNKSIEQKVIDVLCEVYDPEIPVNIYDLGLIYDVQIDDGRKVKICMTLTSPACPVAEALPLEVRSGICRVPEVTDCEVEIVWDPPWEPDRMSEVAKLKLGML